MFESHYLYYIFAVCQIFIVFAYNFSRIFRINLHVAPEYVTVKK